MRVMYYREGGLVNKSGLIFFISLQAANLLQLTRLAVLACSEMVARGYSSNYRGLDSFTWYTIKT